MCEYPEESKRRQDKRRGEFESSHRGPGTNVVMQVEQSS